MLAQLEIISKQMIKPSSPTPLHLRDLQFSFFNQIAVQTYTPFIFFYPSDQLVRDEPFLRLKQSLADVLTVFYPLAGRIRDSNESIECNDKGAEFIEARVHAQLSNVVQDEDPNMEELRQYLPVQPEHHPYKGEKIVLAVQANRFDCGGIAVAVCLSHKIADGTSMATFMKAWAATSRGEALEMVKPSFHVLAGHFPPGDLQRFDLSPSISIPSHKIVTKRFIFNNEKLASLKSAIATAPGSQVSDPSRVEALSAFIWKHFIEHDKHKNHSSFTAVHLVNIRQRMNPRLVEDHAFGNCVAVSSAFTDPDQDGHELHHLAQQLRKEIRKIDSDYIEQIQKDSEGYYKSQCLAMATILKQGTRLCNFTSWWRFPVYEVDYGWGEPVWVCTTPVAYKNVVILMGRPKGDGIEAWINMLREDHINILETIS